MRTQALAWSPNASDQADEIWLALYIAGSDHRIRFCDNKEIVQIFEGHDDYINDLALSKKDSEAILASVSGMLFCALR